MTSFTVLALALAPGVAWPDDQQSAFAVGGLLFGDLYHIPSHHLSEGDGATGAVLRRGYLTFDARPDSPWFGRLRFEVNQSGEFETYDFEADVKDAYVGYKFQRHELKIGLQPTLTFDVVESVWSLRYLMRTPADLQGVPSRDTGISLKGRLNDSWRYRLLVGAGADFGAESGDGRNFMAALNWKLNERWMLDFYVDHEERPGPTDNTTAQLFTAYQAEGLRFGAQYLYRDRESDAPGELASAFLVKSFGRKSRIVGRIDRIMEPSPKGDNISYIPFDPTSRATMFLAGYEYRVSDNVRITPNAILISYDRNTEGVTPQKDVYLRLTLFADF